MAERLRKGRHKRSGDREMLESSDEAGSCGPVVVPADELRTTHTWGDLGA